MMIFYAESHCVFWIAIYSNSKLHHIRAKRVPVDNVSEMSADKNGKFWSVALTLARSIKWTPTSLSLINLACARDTLWDGPTFTCSLVSPNICHQPIKAYHQIFVQPTNNHLVS